MGVARAGLNLAAVGWLVVLSGFDIRSRRLPNALTLPGAAVILAAATVLGRGGPALVGALALSGLYLLVHLAAPTALGAGDVKLAVGVGAWTGCCGAPVWLLAALGAPLLTAVGGLVALRRGVHSVPHGPSMCLASAAAITLTLV